MQRVLCDKCLRTYKPYTYSETLRRALVSSEDEWQGVDDERHIDARYREFFVKSRYNNGIRSYLNELGYISDRDEIRYLFPSVDDFMLLHRQFNKERRTKISASFLCFDCEEYLCAKCITQHSEHFTFSEDDKNNMDKWDKIETKIMHAFNTEGDTKEEYIKQERAVLCNVVDVRDLVSLTELEKFTSIWNTDMYKLTYDIGRLYCRQNMCILNDNQTFLVMNNRSTRIEIYNISTDQQIGSIELPYRPGGITEIPSTEPSQSLIAVSFPNQRQINVINIQRRPADVISSINVHGKCSDLAYSNNKLFTRCEDYLDGEYRDSIHVMDRTGEIINIIDLHKVQGIYNCSSMYLHSERETIYVCHGYGSVTCLSLTGQVLHSEQYWDLFPDNICVDRDQNVYMMGYSLPLYRLSSDLSERVKIVDEDAVNFGDVTSIVHHKNKIYMVSREGFVHIFSVD